MSEITFHLADRPSAINKDFLATMQPLSYFDHNDDLPEQITLNRYTREKWCRHSSSASANNTADQKWKGLWLKCTDKRGRLPGFVKFLKGRAKAAYGKFESPYPDEVTGDERTALLLVPFEQPLFPSKEVLQKEDVSSVSDLIFIKYCLDETEILTQTNNTQPQIQQHPTKPKQQMRPVKQQQQQQQQQRPAVKQKSSLGGCGLLGNLLGTQERTNRHLQAVPTKRRAESTISSLGSSGSATAPNNSMNGGSSQKAGNTGENFFSTSNQVVANFRTKIEKKLAAFESSTETQIKIPISQAEETRLLHSMEEKAKVTMDVLKYIVYEQTEEIGQDEWVAAKEHSEFMDEAIIAIYKAGCAPEEVLEELNKGELPDEAKGQQRFMMEALNREEKKKAKMVEENNMKRAFGQNNEVKRLNNVKRDRRSIEEIQRDMMNDAKRAKP
jgi:hypothetical protein